MIFNYILLVFTLLVFAVSLLPKDYKATYAVFWLSVSALLILAIVYPDAGRYWF
jgi:hypothetical membrane protein